MVGEATQSPVLPPTEAASIPMGVGAEQAVPAAPAHAGRLEGLKRLLAGLLGRKKKPSVGEPVPLMPTEPTNPVASSSQPAEAVSQAPGLGEPKV